MADSSSIRPRILVLNGPNLNYLGRREPIYGTVTLDEVEASMHEAAERLGVTVDFRQSNSEGVLIDAAQEAMDNFEAVILNPAGFTSTSIALRDSMSMLPVPVIEIHITNIHARETWRHMSYFSTMATAIVMGAGTHGYVLALEHAAYLTVPRP
ncbi:MAG TPA: type II 3-dehydroquinate dehydratase [Galbitalea sp.]